jgi:RsiW-degrading membrane proteinase PrsW (M82 family)
MRCEHCGRDVPQGVFCTNCGAHQGTGEIGHPQRRAAHFAAHPGEHVFQPAIFTTLFPHLGHRKVHEFRLIFLGGVAGIFILFFAGLITAALAVATLLIPVLYLLYLYEAQVYREEPILVLGLLALVTVAVGILVTIGTDALLSTEAKFSLTITGGSLVIIGVVIPLIQEVVKPLAALVLRTRPRFPETMDGLVFGVAAGLGFGVGESFVHFAKIYSQLPVHSSPGDWIFPLISTSILVPLLQGTCTGLVVAAVWRVGRGRADLLVLLGLVAAVGGHIAFSIVSQLFTNHGWSDLVILAWQALVVIILLVFVRLLLHRALLDEAAEIGLSEKYCSHDHIYVMAEGFCPTCGMALTAVPYHTRSGAMGAPAPAGGGT